MNIRDLLVKLNTGLSELHDAQAQYILPKLRLEYQFLAKQLLGITVPELDGVYKAINRDTDDLAFITPDTKISEVALIAGIINYLENNNTGALTVDNKYIFADNNARDEYFTTNSAELVDEMYIVSGGVLQKYISGEWVDVSATIRGTSAGFGTPTASATTLDAGQPAEVNVTATGDDTAKIFNFEFGIPEGADGTGNGTGMQEPPNDGNMYARAYINGTYDWVNVSAIIAEIPVFQIPYKKGYTENGSNVFVLPKTPYVIVDVFVLDGETTRYTLQDGDYSVSGNSVTITNPTLADGMSVKILYTAKEAA